jgi:hypothetical protein
LNLLKLLVPFLFFAVCATHAQKPLLSGSSNDEKNSTAPSKKSTFLSLGFGLSNYLGDLGGNVGSGKGFFYDHNFKQRTFFYGLGLSHFRRDVVGLRLEYTWGQISGSDQDVTYRDKGDLSYYRLRRNLDFQSKISELSLSAVCFPFKIFPAQFGIHHWHLQPYMGMGIGLFSFNPQGTYYDEIAEDLIWVDLHPLRTEGQGMQEYPSRKPYQLTQWNMPFTVGLRYALGNKTSMAFEFCGRKLFTDYLDDVSTNYIDPNLFAKYLQGEDASVARSVNNKSNLINPDMPYLPGEQRGNPDKNDFFYSFNVKLLIQINKTKSGARPAKKSFYKYDDLELCF